MGLNGGSAHGIQPLQLPGEVGVLCCARVCMRVCLIAYVCVCDSQILSECYDGYTFGVQPLEFPGKHPPPPHLHERR